MSTYMFYFWFFSPFHSWGRWVSEQLRAACCQLGLNKTQLLWCKDRTNSVTCSASVLLILWSHTWTLNSILLDCDHGQDLKKGIEPGLGEELLDFSINTSWSWVFGSPVAGTSIVFVAVLHSHSPDLTRRWLAGILKVVCILCVQKSIQQLDLLSWNFRINLIWKFLH